ncbi:MAG: class I SAM-dependent methyltransferase [Sulfitobacter sp.]
MVAEFDPVNDEMPKLLSGTHLQILSVLATQLRRIDPQPGDSLNILDIGCGDGILIEYLGKALPMLFKGVEFDLYGFDVGDHGVQADGYFAKTIDHLTKAQPAVDWSGRLALISEKDLWPYSDGFFAATVSNQVLEHVRDHDMFFAETNRVTQTGGVGVHVYPSKHTLIEQHTLVPFAHKCRQDHTMRRMIYWWSVLGRGRFREHKADSATVTPQSYAARHADYLIRYTNFQNKSYFLGLAKKHQLHSTFKYSGLYLTEKLRRMAGKPSRYFAPEAPGFLLGLAAFFGPYLTNVTLLVTKNRDYDMLDE